MFDIWLIYTNKDCPHAPRFIIVDQPFVKIIQINLEQFIRKPLDRQCIR